MSLEEIVSAFANNVAAQTDAIARGDHKTGNKHAREYIGAFKTLRAMGDPGRNALVPLLSHQRPHVRAMAAAFLLRHKTQEAQAVLEAAATGARGLTRFEAGQALKRWRDGTWKLDPLDTTE